MAVNVWGPELAETYDKTYEEQATPEVIGPIVGLLVGLADEGPALEFAAGTGRITLPLARRGIRTHGIELSPHMAAQLQQKPDADLVVVTVGDMCSTKVGTDFGLVFLAANSLMNVTTQQEQVATFRNAADHLRPGGRFVVELIVPQLRRVPPSESGRVFALTDDHVGIETFDDTAAQIAWSHHWMLVDGRLVRHSAAYRYVWPAELDLMAALAGLSLEHRWADWHRQPFTASSAGQVAVYRKTD